MKVENKLIKLGFNPRYKGFIMLVECIEYLKRTKNYSAKMLAEIYVYVSGKNNISIPCVERRIRTLRENCTNGKYKNMVNSEMIKILAVTI